MLLENYPKYSTAFYLMGCIFEKQGEITEGIEYFNKAIDIDTNNVYALFSRGACYNMLGNYEKAIEDYSLALEKDSNRNSRKTMLRNIGKVLGLNNENSLTTHSTNINNMNLSVNPFNDEKSSLDINNSSYLNLNNSKNIESINLDNEMNKYINNQLRDIISSSAQAIPSNMFFDKISSDNNSNNNNTKYKNSGLDYKQILNVNGNKENTNNLFSHGNAKNNTLGNNSLNNTNLYNQNSNNSLHNTNLNFYNQKNDSINSNNISNSILNNRLKGGKLDSNVYSNFKESARNKKNGNNDFINPDDKVNNNFNLLKNKKFDLNSILSQNLNPDDIDNLINNIKNNDTNNKNNSEILENLKYYRKDNSNYQVSEVSSELIQKNYEENNFDNKLNKNNELLNKSVNVRSKISGKSLYNYPKKQSETNIHETNITNDFKSGNIRTNSSIISKNSVEKRDKSILF
jgi:hypothetical protein